MRPFGSTTSSCGTCTSLLACCTASQVLSDVADVCYRIDREHGPSEDRAVRCDDPDLVISWPLAVADISPRENAAGSWADLIESMSR
jgi:dTDP-4-dehydrorhamnose 3,5-epimerase